VIDAGAALDYLGQTVVLELSPQAANELDVDIELVGTVRAVPDDAIGLGLPEYLDESGDLFWLPLSGVEDIYTDAAQSP
jgi:hypothetical protein